MVMTIMCRPPVSRDGAVRVVRQHEPFTSSLSLSVLTSPSQVWGRIVGIGTLVVGAAAAAAVVVVVAVVVICTAAIVLYNK